MRSKLSMALLWVLIFVLGGVAGWFGRCIYRDSSKAQLPVGQNKQARDNGAVNTEKSNNSQTNNKDQELHQIIDNLTRELQLDASQQETLKNIFNEARMQYRTLNKEFRPRYETIRDASDDRIRAMLRADQRERFEEILKPFRPQTSTAK